MKAERLLDAIYKKAKRYPNEEILNDYFDMVRNYSDYKSRDKELMLYHSNNLKIITSKEMKNTNRKIDYRNSMYELHKRIYLFESRFLFDSYLLYVEWDRQPQKKFYAPRRKVLKVLVDDYQDLYERKIRFLGVSLPPRVGKSTLGIFFVTWLMGLEPDRPSAVGGHSDPLTRGFYEEVLNIITNDTDYNWNEVFPNHTVISGAKDTTIDLDRKRRNSTLTCRSIGGTWTGAIDVKNLLYADDLVSDLEEALNDDRMDAKFDAYLNQMKDRLSDDNAIQAMVGTRWGINDPLGKLTDLYSNDPTYRFRVIPALNENGESNFQYDYGLGFTTKYYEDMKKSIDDATFQAKYQGQPYDRENQLFPKEELRYYNGELPEVIDETISVTDIAWGGGDDLVTVIAMESNGDVYIHDVICNNSDKSVTRPLVIAKLKKYLPQKNEFEANNGGHEYSDFVSEELKRKYNIRLNITTRNAPTRVGKKSRIIGYSPEIKNFIYRGEDYRSREYHRFMEKLHSYTTSGKNKHDDVPDALAMLAHNRRNGLNKTEVFRKIW